MVTKEGGPVLITVNHDGERGVENAKNYYVILCEYCKMPLK